MCRLIGPFLVISWVIAAAAAAQLPELGAIATGPLEPRIVFDDVGDVDGDGVHDLVIGRQVDVADGQAEIYSGATGALLHVLAAPQAGVGFGGSVTGIGDVDGDGVGDVAVGSRDYVGAGAIHSYSGASGSLIATIPGPESGAVFASSIDGIGDVDGDGVPDLLVGAPGATGPGGVAAGRVFVFSGSTGATLLTVMGLTAGDLLGRAVAAMGDVDGDGVPDLAAGAPGRGLGTVTIFSGADGTQIAPAIVNTDPFVIGFGATLDRAGDVDGDGALDLLVGAPAEFQQGPGTVLVYSTVTAALVHRVDGAGQERLGTTVVGVGDVNGDGFDDFAASASAIDTDSFGRVWSGRDASVLFETFAQWVWPVTGAAVTGLGDVNGDGFDDVVIGLSGAPTTIWAVAGAQTYGDVPGAIQALDLAWVPGMPGAEHLGAIEAEGARPFATGFAVVGLGAATTVVSGVAVAVDLAPATFFLAEFAFDGAGRVSAPLDLIDPILTGTTFYTQVFAVDASSPAGVLSSNGLALRMSHSVAVPTIEAIEPLVGFAGNLITVDGLSFGTAPTVTLGGVPAVVVTAGPTRIRFIHPGGAGCDVPLVVTNAEGSSTTAVFNPSPVIIGVQPATPWSTGQSIAVTVDHLVAGSTIQIDGTPVALVSASQAAQGLVGFYAPPTSVGPATLTITSPGGCAASTTIHYVAPTPVLTAISPWSAPAGATVTLGGNGFDSGLVLTIDGAVVQPSSISPTQIVYTQPAGLGCNALLVVTNPGGLSFTFPVNPSSSVSTLIPGSGPASGGNTLAISGFIDPLSTVTIGGVSAAVLPPAGLVPILTVIVPPGVPGPATVVVTSPVGCTGTATYTYD